MNNIKYKNEKNDLHYIYRHFYMEISNLIVKRAIVFHNRIAQINIYSIINEN